MADTRQRMIFLRGAGARGDGKPRVAPNDGHGYDDEWSIYWLAGWDHMAKIIEVESIRLNDTWQTIDLSSIDSAYADGDV